MTVADEKHIDVPSKIRVKAAALVKQNDDFMDSHPHLGIVPIRELGEWMLQRTWWNEFLSWDWPRQRKRLLELAEGRCLK